MNATVIREDFDDMQWADYAPGTGFDRPQMAFSLGAASLLHMSVIGTNGSNVDGKALLLRKGTLEIQLKTPATSFRCWFTNAEKGFELTFYAADGNVVAVVTEPDHGGGEKEFVYRASSPFAKVQIKVTADSVFLDSIEAQ